MPELFSEFFIFGWIMVGLINYKLIFNGLEGFKEKLIFLWICLAIGPIMLLFRLVFVDEWDGR